MPSNYQDLSLFKVPGDFRGRSAFIVQLWWFVSATLFKFSPQFAYGWRRMLLRMFGAKIGKGVIVRPTARITYPWKLSIGDFSWVGDHVELYTLGEISIGRNSVVSQRSYLCTGSHDLKSLSFDIYQQPIVIEDEVWIATDVFVAPGVTIGTGTVIGARSSIFKDVQGGVIYMEKRAVVTKARSENG
ncbi:colanic acid biosynthesis acetyltransferase WcaF [Alteromonas aestuariivivens]|uniref:Colanic acid biosynthesis acetyltransferase WcaF n=1 Tax=Alteromonas aestuariivivens TaxID=1938339 RepID=A0A3D8MD14_9ALTE|nr:putative colanic acid biosynthesis acetyltransferase [Alteromonas aestuariivivens]RDV28130.1 colanic acid biosynthesis acetyltransferase WcaF [Alteromonas aestuariivivens]